MCGMICPTPPYIGNHRATGGDCSKQYPPDWETDPAIKVAWTAPGQGWDSAKGAFRVKRLTAVVLGLLLASAIPIAGLAQGKQNRDAEMAEAMRQILSTTREPRQVANALTKHGARFIGLQETTVTFVHTGQEVVPARSTVRTVGADLAESLVTEGANPPGEVGVKAGEKADLTLTLWLYEWQNSNGSYSEQAMMSGVWSDTEYRWIDDPKDVIDVRWTVGDLVYVSSAPFDGVERDQHTQGIASFTVHDQVEAWDLFVNFRPVSSQVYGKWTNIFANYTHTWWGVRLSVSLGAGPTGSTGTITINTDGKTWTKGTGLAFQIGSEETSGPASAGQPRAGRPAPVQMD